MKVLIIYESWPLRPYDLFPRLFVYSGLIPHPLSARFLRSAGMGGCGQRNKKLQLPCKQLVSHNASLASLFIRLLTHKAGVKQKLPGPCLHSGSLRSSDCREGHLPSLQNSSSWTFLSFSLFFSFFSNERFHCLLRKWSFWSFLFVLFCYICFIEKVFHDQ